MKQFSSKICVILILTLITLLFSSCEDLNSSKLEYEINVDGATCTVTGFHNKYITVLRIPESIDGYIVTSIAPYAFEKFEMETVYLPSTIETIGEFAFSYCEKLTEVKGIENCTSLKRIESFTFEHCTNLRKIKLPESVVYIGKCAFATCDLGPSFSLPHNIETIDFGAFNTCITMKQIEIPALTIDIEERVFEGCFSLDTILVDEQNEYWCAVDGVLYSKDMKTLHTYPCGKTDINYTIPDGVKSIKSYAFAHHKSLESITIPTSVTKIGEYIIYDILPDSPTVKINIINYCGTVEMWNSIVKSPNWDADSPDYTIYCTDGQISKDGTITYNQ